MEFRVHPPTTNSVKTINWLFITNAILRFASSHSWKKIYTKTGRVSIDEVINFVYGGRLSKYLIGYTNDLKQRRIRMDRIEDYKGLTWCKEDANYSFSTSGISELI